MTFNGLLSRTSCERQGGTGLLFDEAGFYPSCNIPTEVFAGDLDAMLVAVKLQNVIVMGGNDLELISQAEWRDAGTRLQLFGQFSDDPRGVRRRRDQSWRHLHRTV